MTGRTPLPTIMRVSPLPGGGPRHRGRFAALRARRRPWMAWAGVGVVAGAGFLAVLPAQVLVGGVALGVLASALFLAFPTALVVAWHLRWHQRHDRTDDDVLATSPGVPARLDLDEAMRGPHDPTGRLWLDGREVGRLDRDDDADAPATLTVDGVALRLEARDGPDPAVRLVGPTGAVVVPVPGARRGDLVDWTFPGEPELRLRQRRASVPTRRTLLAADGRAWVVRADHAANRWCGDLPPGTDPRRAALVLWTCAHLDRVGVEHAYPRTGPVTTDRWVRAGGPVRRPGRPEPPVG